jgi:hypothetical protein
MSVTRKVFLKNERTGSITVQGYGVHKDTFGAVELLSTAVLLPPDASRTLTITIPTDVNLDSGWGVTVYDGPSADPNLILHQLWYNPGEGNPDDEGSTPQFTVSNSNASPSYAALVAGVVLIAIILIMVAFAVVTYLYNVWGSNDYDMGMEDTKTFGKSRRAYHTMAY